MNHLNHARTDNRPENLTYVTREENNAHRQVRPQVTHCRRGHPLSGDNLYITPSNGKRVCRICRRRWISRRHLNDCFYCGRPLPENSEPQFVNRDRALDKEDRADESNQEGLPAEEWRIVPGHPEYEVSNHGRFRSYKRFGGGTHRSQYVPPMLKKTRDYAGYETVSLGGGTRKYVHPLVAEAFLGPRPPGYDVAHQNHVRHDNRAENLRYATRQENLSERHKEPPTHCRRGHPMSGDNLYIEPGRGRRVCRACRRMRSKKRNPHDCPSCGRPLPESLKVRFRDPG